MYSESDTKKNLELLTTMQQDIFDEYIGLGGNPDELKISKKTGVDRRALEELMKREAIKDEMTEMIKSMNEDKENTEEKYGYYPNNDDISKYAEESIKVHEKEAKIFNKHLEEEEEVNKELTEKSKKGIDIKNIFKNWKK
jgi:hypothetical protein